MSALLPIGDFARATHLSVKALRHYDDIGLLVPAEVDAATGYRRYAVAQVPAAHLLRRLRELDMPLPEIGQVLAAPDTAARDAAIDRHLRRTRSALAKAEASVSALHALLERRDEATPVERRRLPAQRVAATTGLVAWHEAEDWLAGAYERLHRAVGGAAAGPDGALYGPDFFERHLGEVTAFVPVPAGAPGVPGAAGAPDGPAGTDVATVELPAATYVVTTHHGAFDRLDEAYGALGSHVAANLLTTDGPIREHYVDERTTEVLWPVATPTG
ncbi:MAG TPA: MerR family transcriptional regulator [Acidimicrobiales bacterium]